MRKVISHQSSVISIFFLLFLLTPLSSLFNTYAHVLKTDGSIGAVMHIDPEDDPSALQPASFFFEFKDTKNIFKLSSCDCQVFIYQNGKQLYTQVLMPAQTDAEYSAGFSFTFPQKDIYQMKILGKPSLGSEFKSFTLIYDVRVAKDAGAGVQTSQVSPNWFSIHSAHLIGVGLVALFLIFAVVKQKRKLK